MRVFVIVAAVVVLVGSVGSAQSPSDRPTVSVRDFDFGSIMKWWKGEVNVGKGVAELVVEELLEDGGVRLLERKELKAILEEQDLASSDRTEDGSDQAVQTGRVISARYIVTGSVTKFGGEDRIFQVGALAGAIGLLGGPKELEAIASIVGTRNMAAVVEITARVIDTTTGEILASVKSEGKSKRKGLLLGGAGVGGGTVVAGGFEMTSSNFRETILGEATATAVEELAKRLLEKIPGVSPQTASGKE